MEKDSVIKQKIKSDIIAFRALNAIFIGNNRELIFFLENWINHNHKISYIISDNERVKDWSIKNRISCNSYKVLEAESFKKSCLIPENKPELLFSIINHEPLKETLKAAQLSINYHAGPLPSSPGVYGTSWAIYNDKKNYNLTWHIMSRIVDAGLPLNINIEDINIDQEWDAHRLEIECLKLAKDSFSQVISIIEKAFGTGNIYNAINKKVAKQIDWDIVNTDFKDGKFSKYVETSLVTDIYLQQIRIYKKMIKHKIDENGLIRVNDNANDILKKYQALKFDINQRNYLGTLKYNFNGRILYPDIVSRSNLDVVSDRQVSISKENIVIKYGNDKILIGSLKTESGQKLTHDDLLLINELNTKLKESSDLYQKLKNGSLKKSTSLYDKSNENNWVDYLENVEQATLTFNLKNDLKAHLPTIGFDSRRQKIELKYDLKYQSNTHIAPSSLYLAATLAYLNFINQSENNLTIGYTDDEIIDDVGELKGFYSEIYPLIMRSNMFSSSSIQELCKNINHAIAEIKKKTPFLRDIQLRVPSLHGKDLNSAIVIACNSKYSNDELLQKLYNVPWIFIVVNNNEFVVSYDLERVEEKQVNDFKAIIENLRVKILEILEYNFISINKNNSNVDTAIKQNIIPYEYKPLFLDQSPNLKQHYSKNNFESVVSKFNKLALKHPSKTALIVNNVQYAYGIIAESMLKLNTILSQVPKQDLKDEVIGIFLPSSNLWIVAILGIIHSNKTFTSLMYDKDNASEDSIRSIIKDSNILRVITLKDHAIFFKKIEKSIQIINISELYNMPNSHTQKSNIDNIKLAYIVYTSGSTGKPKGVCITHNNLSFSTQTRIKYYKKIPNKKILPLTERSFDATIGMMFWALCEGSTLVLPTDEERLDPLKQVELLIKNGITHLIATPYQYIKLLGEINKSDSKNIIKQTLKAVIVGGDQWPTSLLTQHRNLFENTELYNEYGPTECTIWTSVGKIFPSSKNSLSERETAIHIGKPIDPSVEFFILDKNYFSLPKGIVGELYIEGPNVAKYKNIEHEINANAFEKSLNPLSLFRRYKSGDMARLTNDNKLLFIGRKDDEVKIKGVRIDAKKIMEACKEIKYIKDVYIIKKSTNILKICLSTNIPLDNTSITSIKEAECKWQIYKKVSADLIPKQVLLCSEFPLKRNGKIDEEKLSKLMDGKAERIKINNFYSDTIIDIWNKVLKYRQIKLSIHASLEQYDIYSFDRMQVADQFVKAFNLHKYEATKVAFFDDINEQAATIEFLLTQKNPAMKTKNHGSILLTGTTGHIGTQFLYEMSLKFYHFKTIYCLLNHNNRGGDHNKIIKEDIIKIKKNIEALGYSLEDFNKFLEDKNKVKFIVGDIRQEKFGLENTDLYKECIENVECIFHFAAKVNHILGHQDLVEVNTDSVKNLIKFVDVFNHKDSMRIHFSSTIQTVTIKSKFIDDDRFGYVKSKKDAEKLLVEYAEDSSKKGYVSIYYMGWAGWNEKGRCLNPESDHFCSLLDTCISMKAMPDIDIDLYMLPIDNLIRQIIDQDKILLNLNNAKNERLYKPKVTQRISWKKISEEIERIYNNSIRHKLNPENQILKIAGNAWLQKLNDGLSRGIKYPLVNFRELYQESLGLLDKSYLENIDNVNKYLLEVKEKESIRKGLEALYKKESGQEVKIIKEIFESGEFETINKLLDNIDSKKSEKGNEVRLFNELETWLSLIPQIDKTKLSAMHLIIKNPIIKEKDKIKILGKLINKYNMSINPLTDLNISLLYEAAACRLFNVFKYLIGMDKNLKDTLITKTDNFFSIFMVACWFGDFRFAKLFLEKMQEHYNKDFIVEEIFTSRNATLEACIHRAITAQSLGIIELIFDKTITSEHDWQKILQLKNEQYERPILHHAAIIGNERILYFLIEKALSANLDALLLETNRHSHNFISFIHPNKSNLKIDIVTKYYDTLFTETMLHKQNILNSDHIKAFIAYENAFINSEKEGNGCNASHLNARTAMMLNLKCNQNGLMSWLGNTTPDSDGFIHFQYLIMFGFDLLVNDFIDYYKNDNYEILKKATYYKNKKFANRTAWHLALRENYLFYNYNSNKINLITFPNRRIIKTLIGAELFPICIDKQVSLLDDNHVTPLYEAIYSSVYIDTNYTQLKKYHIKIDSKLVIDLIRATKCRDIFEVTKREHTLLTLACWRNSYDNAKLIITFAKRLIKMKKEMQSSKILSEIVPSHFHSLPQFLIHQNQNKETALHCAVDNRSRDLVNLLLYPDDNKLDLPSFNTYKDQYGKTALHRAVERIYSEDHLEIVRLLINANFNPHAETIHLRKPEDLLHTDVLRLKNMLKKHYLYKPRELNENKATQNTITYFDFTKEFEKPLEEIKSYYENYGQTAEQQQSTPASVKANTIPSINPTAPPTRKFSTLSYRSFRNEKYTNESYKFVYNPMRFFKDNKTMLAEKKPNSTQVNTAILHQTDKVTEHQSGKVRVPRVPPKRVTVPRSPTTSRRTNTVARRPGVRITK